MRIYTEIKELTCNRQFGTSKYRNCSKGNKTGNVCSNFIVTSENAKVCIGISNYSVIQKLYLNYTVKLVQGRNLLIVNKF
jgi:hypothetical protein